MNTYTPKNDKDTLYIRAGYDTPLSSITEQALRYFEGTHQDQLIINAQDIHTRCIGYDQYDGADYDMYFVITKA